MRTKIAFSKGRKLETYEKMMFILLLYFNEATGDNSKQLI